MCMHICYLTKHVAVVVCSEEWHCSQLDSMKDGSLVETIAGRNANCSFWPFLLCLAC